MASASNQAPSPMSTDTPSVQPLEPSSSSSSSSFTIPSLYDRIPLDCRLYHPIQSATASHCRLAVIAHPYAPLGGSFDDAVVLAAAQTLLADNYVVGTFNFRGAGASAGKTSWTGKPEGLDFVSVIGFILAYASFLDRAGSTNSASGDWTTSVSLVIGGYSYGAMTAMQIPSAEAILGRFQYAIAGSVEAHIVQQAREQTCLHDRERTDTQQSLTASHHGSTALQLNLDQVCYLFISPILGPLAWAIALSNPFASSKRSLREDSTTTGLSLTPDSSFSRHPTYAIYSTNDQFTSLGRLRKWASKIRDVVPASNLTTSEVPDVGHFWLEPGALHHLQVLVRAWLVAVRTGAGPG